MARVMGTCLKRPERLLGYRAFEVEWCTKIPIDPETGEGDMDGCEYARRFVGTIDEALAEAKEVYPLDKFGVVTVTEVEWIDPYEERIAALYRWDYVGDSRHYSGEDGFDD